MSAIRLMGPITSGLVVVLLSGATAADVLVMKNGDTITGTVSQIWDDEVFIEPDYADEFAVEVAAISYMDAEREFEIEFEDGVRRVAQFQGVDDAGNQVILVDGETMNVPLADIRELDEPEEYRDWEANFDWNSNISRGNTDSSNNTLRGNFDYKLGEHRNLLELTFAREEQNGVSTKEQDLYRYTYGYEFTQQWAATALLSYESDPIRNLAHRYQIAPGIAYWWWDSADRTLMLQPLAGYQQEKYSASIDENGNVIPESEESNAIAGWFFRFNYHFSGPDLTVYHQNSFTSNISGRTNNVLKTITGTRFEITDLLYLNFEIDFDYESNPENAEKHDVRFLGGIGMEFE